MPIIIIIIVISSSSINIIIIIIIATSCVYKSTILFKVDVDTSPLGFSRKLRALARIQRPSLPANLPVRVWLLSSQTPQCMKRYESDGTLLTRSTYNSLQYFASRDPLAGTYSTYDSLCEWHRYHSERQCHNTLTVHDQFESIAVRGEDVHTSARNYHLVVSVYLHGLSRRI